MVCNCLVGFIEEKIITVQKAITISSWYQDFGHIEALNNLNVRNQSKMQFLDSIFTRMDFVLEIDIKQFCKLYFLVI